MPYGHPSDIIELIQTTSAHPTDRLTPGIHRAHQGGLPQAMSQPPTQLLGPLGPVPSTIQAHQPEISHIRPHPPTTKIPDAEAEATTDRSRFVWLDGFVEG